MTYQRIITWILLAGLSCLPLLTQAENSAANSLLNQVDLAKALGWVPKPDADNICQGYYIEPDLNPSKNTLAASQNPLDITASNSILQWVGQSTFVGNVHLTQPYRLADADRAEINRNSNLVITTADLYGNVILREPGKLILSQHGHLDLQHNAGHWYDVWYHLLLTPPDGITTGLQTTATEQKRLSGLTAHGHATDVEQQKPQHLILQNTTYSTCSPLQRIWFLKAKKIKLNQETGRGDAYDTLVYFQDVPVFYLPYFNFPIDKRRQSGILPPLYGNSTTGGLQIGIPYYWNIAPNYDATLTPGFYSKRGAWLAGKFRYLTGFSNGVITASILPNDQAFQHFQRSALNEYAGYNALSRLESASENRRYFSWLNDVAWDSRWSSSVNYSAVSDDYYFQDFSAAQPSIANQLLQQANVTYNGDIWNFQTNVQKYQTLHPVNQPAVSNQYAMLPQIILNGSWIAPHHLNLSWNSEIVNFTRSANPGEIFSSTNGQPSSGQRLTMEPGVMLDYRSPAGYIDPSLQFVLTQYTLSNQQIYAGQTYAHDITRSIPIVAINSGLYVERHTELHHHDYTQTLEPQIFYLYVPYRSQYQIPLFDTGTQPFTFDQLFRTNRFTGIDRIGDANQISVALTTRFLDGETGTEKLSADIGRIFYAQDRRVMLCNTPNCTDPSFNIGTTSPIEKASPIAGVINYHLNATWNIYANVAWDPQTHATNNGGFNFQYMPITNKIINVGYNFVQYGDVLPGTDPSNAKNNLNQTTVSFAWPLPKNWQLLGNWNYNLSHQHGQTFFYGAQYDSCCWAIRFLAGRTYTGLSGSNSPIYNKQIFLQFEFKGLGAAGSTNVGNTLMTLIPGYKDLFNQQNISSSAA